MKNSKRILGVILSLMMLVNIFAVSAFAGYPDDAACALIITPDKTNYSAGDEVTFTVSVKASSEVGEMRVSGQFEMGYDAAGLEPYSTSKEVADHGFAVDSYFEGTFDPTISQVAFHQALTEGLGSAVTEGKSWTQLISFMLADVGPENSLSKACETDAIPLFTFKMRVPATAADGNYTIGFNQFGYEGSYSAYANDKINDGLYGNSGTDYGYSVPYLYDFGEATITVGEGGSTPPSVSVVNTTTQVQWGEAGKLRVAFRGNILGYDASADLLTGSTTDLNKLTEIGVMFSKTNSAPTRENGATVVKAYTIYDFTSGGYFFRAIVENVPYDSTETLYANAYVIYDGNEITATNGVTATTGAAEYSRAIGNGLTPKA